MASYHFPIILGQNKKERIVIVHLTDGKEDYQENRVAVVSSSPNEPLFRIPKEAQMIDASGFTAQFQATDDLTITDTSHTIALNEKDDFYEYTVNDNVDYGYDGRIEFKYICGKTTYVGSLNIIRTDDRNVLKINIDLGSEATQATCFCKRLAAGECLPINLIDAIKGTYIKKRDYNKLIIPPGGILFTQQDENANYYKTGNITFHNFSANSYGDLSLNEDPEPDKSVTHVDRNTHGQITVKPFINYLNVAATGKNANNGNDDVWSVEAPYSEKLPNIKVLYKDTTRVGQLCNVQVQWKSSDGGSSHSLLNKDNITSVLRVIYKQIITAAEKGLEQFYNYKRNNIKATSVLVLVPNIYLQEDIDNLLYELNKLNSSASIDKANGKMRYDFRVISESDAAFLGVKEVGINGNETILNKINREVDDDRQKDTYLIIDSGKGTTDFSIINYNPGDINSVSSYKRGGISGAGAAIDYVFTRIVARQIYKNSSKTSKCNEADFIGRFMEVISQLPPTRQDKVMRIIELAKKKYDVNKGKIPTVCNCFPTAISDPIMNDSTHFDIVSILSLNNEWNVFEESDWDKSSYTQVEDIDKKEIESVCNMIAEETINIIFGNTDEHITNRIDVVLMTGRSFLFKPLRSAFEKKLNKKKGIFNVNYSGFLAYIGNAIIYRPEFNKMKKGKPTRIKEKLAERANLKIDDTTLSLDMKEVSVKFSERDLGYNCNSDLCCLDSLILMNNDKEFEFKQENFWKGFTYTDNTPVYYIGYMETSFAGRNKFKINGSGITDLVKMTLFPNTYIAVTLL